jgi:hypothetical protein
MEGWRQERLGSRAGTHREEEKKTSLQEEKRKNRKTHLTHTGLLMEGILNYREYRGHTNRRR